MKSKMILIQFYYENYMNAISNAPILKKDQISKKQYSQKIKD